jgi:DNA-binding NarL/FixJ family response regulator
MPRPSKAQTTAIEQALARGWTVYRIAEQLDVSVARVRAVRDEMNRLAREVESK